MWGNGDIGGMWGGGVFWEKRVALYELGTNGAVVKLCRNGCRGVYWTQMCAVVYPGRK